MTQKYMTYSKGLNEMLSAEDINDIIKKWQKEFDAQEITSYSQEDLQKLNSQIQEFDFNECGKMPIDEIHKVIWDTLLIKKHLCALKNMQSCAPEISLYRVRKEEKYSFDKEKYKDEKQLWNPPSDKVKFRGRLNECGQSVLYTSPKDPFCAMDEMQVQDDEEFVLIRYLTKKSNILTLIGGPTNYCEEGINGSTTIVANEIVQNFLNKLFGIRADGNEEIYKITNTVIEDFFFLGDTVGWVYRSVKNSGRYNFCFKSEGVKEILDVDGAYLARKNKSGQLEILDTIKQAHYHGDMKGKYMPNEFEYDFCDIFPYQREQKNTDIVEINFFDVEDIEFKRQKKFFRISSEMNIKCLMGIRNNIYKYLNDNTDSVELYYLYVTQEAQLERKLLRKYKVEKTKEDIYEICNLYKLDQLTISVKRECMIMVELVVKSKIGDEQKVGGGELWTVFS